MHGRVNGWGAAHVCGSRTVQILFCLSVEQYLFVLTRPYSGGEERMCSGRLGEIWSLCKRCAVKSWHCVRLRTDMLNLSANRWSENVLLDQLVVFVLSFEGIYSIRGERRPESRCRFLVCHTAAVFLPPGFIWNSALASPAVMFVSLTVHTHMGKHTYTLPVLTGMLPHTGVASRWLLVFSLQQQHAVTGRSRPTVATCTVVERQIKINLSADS